MFSILMKIDTAASSPGHPKHVADAEFMPFTLTKARRWLSHCLTASPVTCWLCSSHSAMMCLHNSKQCITDHYFIVPGIEVWAVWWAEWSLW